MAKHSLTILASFLVLMLIGCRSSSVSSKEIDSATMKVEILAEVRQMLTTHGISADSVQTSRTQLKREIEQEVIRQLQMIAPDSEIARASETLPQRQAVSGPTGMAAGTILCNGQGLAQCRVKLVRLIEAQTLAGLIKVSKEGTEFELVTDHDGNYRFQAIPAGDYKLKWQLPGDSAWIRRLRDKPDVTIEQGKSKTIKAIETSRGVVSG